MARLVWRHRSGEGRTFVLGDKVFLGRDASADCVLDVKSVSRRHVKVERRDGDWYITDLGSTNGTRVNGTPIEKTTRLGPGDLIQVGDEVLEFHAESPTTQTTGHLTRGSMATAALERRSEGPGGDDERGSQGQEVLPRRAGKFYLLRRLGTGGMGSVYHAIDLDSNREVAVKFIRAKIGRNEAFLDFFHNREAVLAREINHPNVIRIYEHGVDSAQHYIAMEYVRGQNLYHVMKERKLEPAEVLEVVRQVACGLVAAHRQGVVHSDIKPANLLIVGEVGRAAVPTGEGTGETEEMAGGDGILEFDTEAREGEKARPLGERYDPGLLEEIRRRVGEPSLDVIVDPPFFQRPSEMNFLAHYLEKALEGRGYFLLVEGEPGTGKNRLLSEFLKEAQAGRGGAGETARADGTASAGEPPAWPRPRFHELDCSRIEGIPRLYEELFQIRPNPKAGLRQVAEDVTRCLGEYPEPRVIRLLNLGQAIPIVCEWIGGLAPLLSRSPALLLGNLAPGDPRSNDGLKAALDRMAPHMKELYLRPLTEYQIQRYLQQIFRDALTGLDLASDLYRLSGGNFAKLLELLRGFFERSVLSLDQPSGRLRYRPRSQEFELEEGKNLYALLKAFGKVEQRVLEHAAFVGQRFVFDALLKLHDLNETSLFFIVRTLLAQGFFVEEGRTWYSFTNVAFQRYMAERIPAPERPHLHRKISRILQNVAVPESPELFQLRGRHWAGCHEYARAVGCLLEGAHLARCAYRADRAREMVQEILRIYRLLARRESVRKEVTGILRDWFRKEGNWYEILGELASDQPEPRVKIADFGISFRMTDEERGYQLEKRPVLGTPRYMAPERGKGEYGGFKSDIFSLGIIAFEMAAGGPPFPELKGNDVVQANRELKILLPAEVLRRFPAGMEACLAGMVEKDPQRRWDAERVVREVAKLELDLKAAVGR
ncbi:MAG: protein kinase [Planctomycetes bacterium]|nr:protein kinase [Planctomycetota bacterium]